MYSVLDFPFFLDVGGKSIVSVCRYFTGGLTFLIRSCLPLHELTLQIRSVERDRV